MHNTAPRNLQELQQRCQQIAGKTIGHLAEELKISVPSDLMQAKGWIGQLIESYLGASASSKAMPDFPDLGIELKTIPVNLHLKPLESTYVCTVQSNEKMLQWRDSWVYNKLKHVLWVPCLASPELEITERTINRPILWHMDPETEDILRTDWEELMDMLQLGYAKSLTAKYGTYLHIRPKAANSKVLIDYVDAEGNNTKIVPKGFYLRSSFTRAILQQNYVDGICDLI
jgi:DNA mismatch repair protein MutH